MRQPTRTVFHLALKVQPYLDQLTLISQAGKIWIVPGPPPAHLVGTQAMTMADFMERVIAFSGPGVMIELDPSLIAELKHQLDEWKSRK